LRLTEGGWRFPDGLVVKPTAVDGQPTPVGRSPT